MTFIFLFFDQAGQDCGGGYLKLYSQSPELDLNKVTDKVSTTLRKVRQR